MVDCLRIELHIDYGAIVEVPSEFREAGGRVAGQFEHCIARENMGRWVCIT